MNSWSVAISDFDPRNIIQRAMESRFVRGVAVLSSGQALAIAVPIAAAPILGRLYAPSEYGVLAGYMAISNVLSGIGNWQYAQGVLVENRENKAYGLMCLCVLTTAVTTLCSALIGIGVFLGTAEGFGNQGIWFLLLPLSTMMAGLNSTFTAIANRRKKYRSMSAIRVVNALLTTCGSIALGVAGYGVTGLFLGYFAGQIASFCLYASLYFHLEDRRRHRFSMRRVVMLAMKHRDFALFTTPASFVGNFAMQLPVYAIGLLGAPALIGLFSRARQLLSLPVSLFGGAIAQVFLQQASAERASSGSCLNIFQKTFFGLLGLGLLPVVLLAIAAPWLFETFLGPNWREAGSVARILSPMLLLRFVCSPLAKVFYVAKAQREDFALSIIGTAITFIAIAIPFALNWDAIFITVAFSASYCLTYLIYIVRAYQLCKC